MQHVIGAQQGFDWFVQWQVHLRTDNDDIILTIRVSAIHAERVGLGNQLSICRTHDAVGTRVAECPLPLLTHGLELSGIVWHSNKASPDK